MLVIMVLILILSIVILIIERKAKDLLHRMDAEFLMSILEGEISKRGDDVIVNDVKINSSIVILSKKKNVLDVVSTGMTVLLVLLGSGTIVYCLLCGNV